LIATENEEPGLFVLDLTDGNLTKIASGAMKNWPSRLSVSPDSHWIAAASPEGGLQLFAADGSGSREVKGSEQSDYPARWGDDSTTLQVYQRENSTLTSFEIDLATGTRKRLEIYRPADPAGIEFLADLLITNDDLYAYSYLRRLSNLYLVGNLH
jgi:hypothetical protein